MPSFFKTTKDAYEISPSLEFEKIDMAMLQTQDDGSEKISDVEVLIKRFIVND